MHGAILKIALCIVQCLRHRSWMRAIHQRTWLILDHYFHFLPFRSAVFRLDFVSLIRCSVAITFAALHHYVSVFFLHPIHFIARKVNIYFVIGIQCAVIVGCEKEHILFLFISFTFISEWVNLLCSQSHFGMPSKKKWLLVLIKSRLAAQIRRWIYFGFNGCVHLICLRWRFSVFIRFIACPLHSICLCFALATDCYASRGLVCKLCKTKSLLLFK